MQMQRIPKKKETAIKRREYKKQRASLKYNHAINRWQIKKMKL